MTLHLAFNFDRMAEDSFSVRYGLVIRSLTGNPKFPEPWHANVAPLARISARYESYLLASHAAMTTRDPARVAERNEARVELTDMLRHLVPYLELQANGDRDALAATGFELRGDAPRSTTAGSPPPEPADFRVKHGPRSGTLDVHVARVDGAASYEVAITTGDPTADAGWAHALTATSAMHMIVEGLTPAQTVWVRVRAINSAGYGAWTRPQHIIVV
ncbi:MAG: hypothetical protein RIQ60_2376 [Pseudomonadota bacterium]